MIPSDIFETLMCSLQTELNLTEEIEKHFELNELDLQVIADIKKAQEWLEQQEVKP